MKKAAVFNFGLLLVGVICLPHSIAQDFALWGLPEGAKTRLGKGKISEIKYSPDGTRLGVGSSIGVWLYDTATHQEVTLRAAQTDVVSFAFSPDGHMIASGGWDAAVHGAGRGQSMCGTPIRENSCEHSTGIQM